MPHCIIEYSEVIDSSAQALVNCTFQGALSSGLFQAEDIKVRALGYRDYCVGGKKSPFIHVTTRLLPGRTAEQKMQLSNSILAQLDSLELANTSISVEAIDIDKSCYAKTLTATA